MYTYVLVKMHMMIAQSNGQKVHKAQVTIGIGLGITFCIHVTFQRW